MSTPTTFHPFPRLPVELRLKIWSLAHLEPRTVNIDCKKGFVTKDVRFVETFLSSTPPPAPLHVCRQSRYDALGVYTPLFKTKTSERYTYVNIATDTIRCSDSLLEYFGKEEVRDLQRLELEVRDGAYFAHFNMETVKKMANLKYLVLECKEVVQNARSRNGIDTLMRDLEMERMSDPGWNRPEIRMIKRDTGELLSVIEGGADIPGWISGDPYPDEV